MTRLGDRLRAFAARVFDAGTMERVIDPAIADLQLERFSWASYLAVFKVFGLCVLRGSFHALHAWPDEDYAGLRRTLARSSIVLTLVTALGVVPELSLEGVHRSLFASPPQKILVLLLEVLAVGVPTALTLGIGLSLGGRTVSGRVRLAVLAIAMVCSLGVFADLGWLEPAAARSLNLAAATRRGMNPTLMPRNAAELSIGELRRRVQLAKSRGGADLRSAKVAYNSRYLGWALSSAPFFLAAFMLSIVAGRAVRQRVLALAACLATFGYFALFFGCVWGRFAGDPLPPVVALLPNAALIVGAFVELRALRVRRVEFAR